MGLKTDRTRLTLELSAELNNTLERVASESGKSKADLLRLGVEFILRAREARKDGMHVGAWSEDPATGLRKKEREFVGL